MKKTIFTNFLSKSWLKMAVLPLFFLASVLWVQDAQAQTVVLGEQEAYTTTVQVQNYIQTVESGLKALKSSGNIDGFNNNLMLVGFYRELIEKMSQSQAVSQHVLDNLAPAQLLPILLNRVVSAGNENDTVVPTSKQ